MVDLRQDPVMNAIHNGIRKGIVIALENRCFGSAVILILSGIDAMAYLSMPDGQDDVKGEDFIAWAEKYVRFPGGEQLTGADLYGARCAMLHSYGVRSRMSRQGKCRMIGYMDESNPPIRFNPHVSKELVLVSVPALRDALFQGMDRFLIDVYKNPKSKEAQLANERFKTLVHDYPTNEL
jgi:hypothetical protein